MAYGDASALELEVDMVMKVSVNDATDVTLDQAVEAGYSSPNYTGSGASQPAITTVVLLGAGPRMPAAGGPERYRVRLSKER